MSRANLVVGFAKSGVLDRARAFLARTTDRHKPARTPLHPVPVLTLMLRTQAENGNNANRSAKTQRHESSEKKSLRSRCSYDCPHRDDGDGVLDLEWVDLNWDDFK